MYRYQSHESIFLLQCMSWSYVGWLFLFLLDKFEKLFSFTIKTWIGMKFLCKWISFNIPDFLSCVHGSLKEHDFPVWPWNLSDVWRPDDWMPNLSQSCRKTHPPLLTEFFLLAQPDFCESFFWATQDINWIMWLIWSPTPNQWLILLDEPTRLPLAFSTIFSCYTKSVICSLVSLWVVSCTLVGSSV